MRARPERSAKRRGGWLAVLLTLLTLLAAAGYWVATSLEAGAPGVARDHEPPLPAPASSNVSPAATPTFALDLPPLPDPVEALAEPAAPGTSRTATGSASLELRLLQPSGAPASGVRVTLSTGRLGGVRQPTFPTDDDGQISVVLLPTEVALTLRGYDRLDNPLLRLPIEPLADGEQRALSATVERNLRAVILMVRDRWGRPLLGATTSLVAAVEHESTRRIQLEQRVTGPDGLAHFAPTSAISVSASAQLGGLAPAWLSEVPLDRDPLQLELVLDAGHVVDVEIADERGNPRDVDAIELRGSPVTVEAQHTGLGGYRFAAYPSGATGITASVQGFVWSVDHDARDPVARLVVPAAGALSVTWQPWEGGCIDGELSLSSEPAGWGWSRDVDEYTYVRGGPVLIESLAPGEYLVMLDCSNGGRVATPTYATVRSELTTEVRLGP